jgi:thymidylate synthase
MILLQQTINDQIHQLLTQQITLLESAIAALWAVIIGLALFIRKILNDHAKISEKREERYAEIAEKNTAAFTMVSSSIQVNTTATENAAEQQTRSVDSLRNAVENLNRDILKRRP